MKMGCILYDLKASHHQERAIRFKESTFYYQLRIVQLVELEA